MRSQNRGDTSIISFSLILVGGRKRGKRREEREGRGRQESRHAQKCIGKTFQKVTVNHSDALRVMLVTLCRLLRV